MICMDCSKFSPHWLTYPGTSLNSVACHPRKIEESPPDRRICWIQSVALAYLAGKPFSSLCPWTCIYTWYKGKGKEEKTMMGLLLSSAEWMMWYNRLSNYLNPKGAKIITWSKHLIRSQGAMTAVAGIAEKPPARAISQISRGLSLLSVLAYFYG